MTRTRSWMCSRGTSSDGAGCTRGGTLGRRGGRGKVRDEEEARWSLGRVDHGLVRYEVIGKSHLTRLLRPERPQPEVMRPRRLHRPPPSQSKDRRASCAGSPVSPSVVSPCCPLFVKAEQEFPNADRGGS